jgi:hypothetical protein
MQFLKRFLTATAALALLAGLLTLAAPKQAHALVTTWVTVVNAIGNPVVTQDTPHMASQLVTLVALVGPAEENIPGFFNQVDPLANISTANYQAPPTQNLVITSVEFYPAALADAPVYFGLLFPAVGAGGGYYQFWKVTSDSSTSFQYPSGIVLGAGVVPSMAILPPFPPSVSFKVFLHGYLTAN